jgi:hypothetical protein
MKLQTLGLRLTLVLTVLLLAACGKTPTPLASATAAPVVAPTATTPAPAAPVAAPTPTAEPEGDTVEVVLYDDDVAAGWTLSNSWGMTVDDASAVTAQSGQHAIAVTPAEDYGGLFFSVDSVSGGGYAHNRFLGLRFWLNPGDQPMALEDLAVALVGSDDRTYWSRETSSVPQDKTPFVSELQLYELGLAKELPADGWVKVELWFQLQANRSPFRYITGVYIKNGAGVRHTFYVDDVSLVALRDKTPPAVVEVANLGLNAVALRFSEDVNAQMASDRGNFTVNGQHPDLARYDPDLRQTMLTLGQPLVADTVYTVAIGGIVDLATPPNPIAEGTEVTFTAMALRVVVDVQADVHPISPHIYGLSGPPPEYMAELKNTLNSWGGNASTRYNWKLGNAWNAARDWYYSNGDYGYRGESASDDFMRENDELDIVSLLTIPTIGWVAKDTTSCAFPQPDGTCSDGSGASCEHPGLFADPTQTSVEAPPEFMVEWLEHLDQSLGLLPQFLGMDNEPDIWGATHYDIHPQCTTYDELYQRYTMYAAPLKAVAPDSEILGPVSCCWWYYWNSMAGEADKHAHDGMDLIPWFLREMAAYEAQEGQRILDVLDVHYYPAGLYHDDVTPEVAAARIRSTRSLWDPTFVDESWIGEPVYLAPRMLGLIDTYYPGTKFGIGEWNWGAEETMNGAVTIADVLGIYGREQVYLAAYWRYPDLHSPGFYAFKIFTNYDGQGARFGDTSVRAASDDQSLVGSYAALDSATGNLHLMLINKHPGQMMTTQVELGDFAAKPSATQYRYDSSNHREIVTSTVPISDKFAIELPPYSITLLVVEPEGD